MPGRKGHSEEKRDCVEEERKHLVKRELLFEDERKSVSEGKKLKEKQ